MTGFNVDFSRSCKERKKASNHIALKNTGWRLLSKEIFKYWDESWGLGLVSFMSGRGSNLILVPIKLNEISAKLVTKLCYNNFKVWNSWYFKIHHIYLFCIYYLWETCWIKYHAPNKHTQKNLPFLIYHVHPTHKYL